MGERMNRELIQWFIFGGIGFITELHEVALQEKSIPNYSINPRSSVSALIFYRGIQFLILCTLRSLSEFPNPFRIDLKKSPKVSQWLLVVTHVIIALLII